MSITDELRKLADLRAEGQLSEAEFADAKRRLLAEDGGRPAPDAPVPPSRDRLPEGWTADTEKRYRSSRWSSGNFFFPDCLVLATDGILFRKGSLFGSREERINYRAVASIRIRNRIFLATLTIETSGGSQPIFINGLWKSGAREIQDIIRAFQRTA